MVKGLGSLHVRKANNDTSCARCTFHHFDMATTGQELASVFGNRWAGEGSISCVGIGIFHIDLNDGIGWQESFLFGFDVEAACFFGSCRAISSRA